MKTLGVSPKLVAAVAAAIVSYLITQQVLELPPLAVLLLNAGAVALAAAAASPGEVVPKSVVRKRSGEAGQLGDPLHLLVYVVVFVILVLILLRVLDHV